MDADDNYSTSVKVTVDNLLANQVSSFEIGRSTDTFLTDKEIPGYIDDGYNFVIEGEITGATVEVSYDRTLEDKEFDPALYYFNEENQLLELVDNQINENGKVIAHLEHFSKYILINKTEYVKNWNYTFLQMDDKNKFSGLDIAFLIDGQVAYTGGVNIADEYVNKRERFGHWKDTALRLDGSAVQTLKALFLTMWSVTGVEDKADMDRYLQEKPQKRESQGLVLPYANSPLTYHKVAESVYLHLLNTSTEYVYIMTPYLILDDELVRAMTFAARRGVDVRIIMPGIPDKQYAFDIATTYFKVLLDAGVRIFRYTPGFVHAKVYLSDAKQAVVGTINTDYRSLYQNFENGVYLYNNLEVLNIEQDFENTQALSEEVTLESLSKMPLVHRLNGYLLSLIGPLM